MELLKEFRLKIGKAMLAKRVARARRGVHYSNFNNIRTIGIVWDASKPAEFSTLSRFHQKMHEMKIDVMILGYFPGKNLPDQYTAIRYFRCIKKDEINSFFQPDSSETSSFIKNPFDILIDINFDNEFPLKYVTSLSKARLKVGLYDPGSNDSVSDLMIELKKPVDLESYLNQIIHYLEMIKDKNLKTVE
jgi:Family of unknown function (DUF6913)